MKAEDVGGPTEVHERSERALSPPDSDSEGGSESAAGAAGGKAATRPRREASGQPEAWPVSGRTSGIKRGWDGPAEAARGGAGQEAASGEERGEDVPIGKSGTEGGRGAWREGWNAGVAGEVEGAAVSRGGDPRNESVIREE